MFDISFVEIALVLVIALMVLGPERLPRAAKMVGLWVRRAKASWYSVKAEFERELADDELKRSLQQAQREIGEAKKDFEQAAREPASAVSEIERETRDGVRSIGRSVGGEDASGPAKADRPQADALQPPRDDDNDDAPRDSHRSREP